MKSLLAASLLVVACTPPPADRTTGSMVHGKSDGPTTAKLPACGESKTLSLVLMGEGPRAELAARLEQGVVLVTMPECDGVFWPTEDCRADGDYQAADDVVTNVDKVRTEADAAGYVGGPAALRARPSGFDVGVRGAIVKLDGKSLGEPSGGHCGQVTHMVTAAMLGAYRIAAADSGAVEFPEAGADAGGPVKSAGDPEACKKDGVRSPDCRVLLAVHLRAVGGGRPAARGGDGHVETGIIAPH